jgi:hypothetical protein
MDIKSLNEFVKFDERLDLFDLVPPSMVYIPHVDDFPDAIKLSEFKVERVHEMRIDLLFSDLYGLNPNEVGLYLENIDIICSINNIDNPLNLREGTIIKYPPIEDFDKFRANGDTFIKRNDKSNKILVPNKSTRRDNNRQNFVENGYSLPPVVLDRPRAPVRIEGRKFSIGGI